MTVYERVLIRGLVSTMALFENSSADEIDPDLAVKGLETVSACLLELSDDDQRVLRDHFSEVATTYADREYREFVRALPDSIGLAKPNPPTAARE